MCNYTECIKKKKLTLLDSLPNEKCETVLRNFYMYGMALIYHMTPKTSENYSCFGEHWPLLLRVWKLGCARISCPFWLIEKSPSVEIDDGLVNLWLIMIGMGLCRVWRVPPLAPRSTKPLSTPPYPTACTITSPITPSNTDTITNTTPGNANKTSTIHLWLKCNACSLIHKLWLHKPYNTQQNQYPSWLIINSSHHRKFLRWGIFRSAKTDSQFLRNLIFTPFTKVASAHPSINYFQILWCHRWDLEPYILMKISQKCFTVFIWRTIQKCQLFLDIRYRPTWIYKSILRSFCLKLF